jgi:hypothetical protein
MNYETPFITFSPSPCHFLSLKKTDAIAERKTQLPGEKIGII